MNWFGIGIKTEADVGSTANASAEKDTGDVWSGDNKWADIFKAYIPEFLYKPPFGYPRKENLPLIRQLAKNPYIYSIVKTLCDEVASTDREIIYRKGVEATPELDELKKTIEKFFQNPNQNKESFNFLLRALTKDILELDSGVWIKVFNKKGEFSQLFARDGGSFLKNPDIYGYMGNKKDFVKPVEMNLNISQGDPNYQGTLKQYQLTYNGEAAYFQYGWTGATLPVPFGKRELMYIMANPRSDSIYGLSPIQILADVIMTLVYGANYNLDFYMNNNMPEGIISFIGGQDKHIKAFRERLDNQVRVKDKLTGFWRKVGFKIPIASGDVKFTPFQLDPKVMEILPQQEWFTKIMWMCFGITADEMGFTEKSNKSTGENQLTVYKRKAVRPVLDIIKYHIDMELIPEWGQEAFDAFELKWNDYDIEEDIKKHSLYKQKLDLGIITPEMIADEEGVDYTKVKAYNEEKEAKEAEKFDKELSARGNFNPNNAGPGVPKPKDVNDKKPTPNFKKKSGEKAKKPENELEKALVDSIESRGKELLNALDALDKSALDQIE